MANQLNMAIRDTIVHLSAQGWSARRIALQLGIHRDTVARHLRQVKLGQALTGAADVKLGQALTGAHEPKLGQALTGSAAVAPAVETAPPPATPPQPSLCEPFRALIQAKLELGLTAQRIHQDLVAEHHFTGKYHSVRRFVKHLSASQTLPFRRVECGPGEEAQVDFGTGAPLVAAGQRRRTYVFRIVLSHSRKAYSEAVTRQTTDNFLRCLENAFWHFGGVPRRLVLDNLRAAVTRADWFDPELNPKVRSFAEHYGTVLLPTKPYTPRHKGKVEKGIDYVQGNALKGRTFASLEQENVFLQSWEQTVADTRVHGTTRRQVGPHFADVERAALQPLALERFACFQEARRKVHRDGHVEVDRAYYSAPPEYLARHVWVRWDGRLVRLFNDRFESIAVHAKQPPGRFSTQGQHIASQKINSVERGAAWLLGQVRPLGPHSVRWAEALLQVRGVEGVRVLQGLLSLARRHPHEAIEHACDVAHSHGCYRLRTLRALLARSGTRQEALPFLEEHPLIRELSAYGQFVHEAFQKEVGS
jgi:transposase